MRSPICAFLGHVDAGKTSIMDAIRNTAFAYKETGGLTQNIGITEVPTDRIKKICVELLKKLNVAIKVDSVIFIDSPGHEAFVTLRERGASIADIAILVIDITEGVQRQTIESIDILKSYKTPFMVALTKIDRVDGCIDKKDASFMDFMSKQNRKYSENLDASIYKIAEELSNYGFQAERYDRIVDFTKQISILPVSAVNNIGIQDLIVMLIGLSQRYIDLNKSAGDEAAVLEEKQIKGMGKAYDAIVYSGKISVGDRVVIQKKDSIADTKIKAMFKLIPMEESRENFGTYEGIKSASASAPIRLVLQDSEVLIGTSISAFHSDEERKRIVATLEGVTKGYNDEKAKGTVVCADSIGSIDAIKKIGAANSMQIGMTRLGEPTKREIMIARLNEKVILCFNVAVSKQIEELSAIEGVSVISSNSIYTIFEKYNEFKSAFNRELMRNKTSGMTLPAELTFIKGNVFRRSNPCVIGVEVLAGEIRPGYKIINQKGVSLGRIQEIQGDKKKLDSAVKGEKVAISIDDAVYERNIFEGDALYTDMGLPDMIKFGDVKSMLGEDYNDALQKIQKIKRI